MIVGQAMSFTVHSAIAVDALLETEEVRIDRHSNSGSRRPPGARSSPGTVHQALRPSEDDVLAVSGRRRVTMTPRRFLWVPVTLIAGGLALAAQQEPDRAFRPAIQTPAYAVGKGPIVCLDEAHANFHTLDGRFWTFGELLRRDGYVVRPNRKTFSRASLADCAILVIANAQPGGADWNAYPYPTPSAFGPDEIAAVHRWVRGGGNLLLIADHMPLAGAAAGLAGAFGVTFTDGFAVEDFSEESGVQAALARPTIFSTSDGTLRPHAIVLGRTAKESVASVRTFTGQAFQAPAPAQPVLVVPASFIVLMPTKAWQFGPDTRRIPAGGWLQGAAMRVGSGRAAFFGEAAMFSAQLAGAARAPMGMNAPGAEQNFQFVLNVMHWLSRLL